MAEKILLSKYFDLKNIIAKEDIVELKPSPRGLEKLKERLEVGDWEMVYIGDSHDDFLSAKGANVFFCMIAQGLVGDLKTLREMKEDEFGGGFIRLGKKRFPKFIVAFNYGEAKWWFETFQAFERRVKAVCFDLGDTLIVGGREEAYKLADKNWPTWEVDRLLTERNASDKLRSLIMELRLGNRWRKLGELPGMNSSEARVSAFFLLNSLGLNEKDLAFVLYSAPTRGIVGYVEELGRFCSVPINTKAVSPDTQIKDLAGKLPSKQFSLFLASGLYEVVKSKREVKLEEIGITLLASFVWISEYRKHELAAYREHSYVPRGLKEFLEFLRGRGKKLAIYSSKSRKVIETALAYEKEVVPSIGGPQSPG